MTLIDTQTQAVARGRVRQLAAAMALAEKRGYPVEDGFLESMYGQIERSYLVDAPAGALFENSHLVIHAEGPGASDHAPRLAALNWLSGTAERTLKVLAAAWLDMKNADGRALARNLDLRLAGLARGSIWMGFRIEPPRDEALVGELAARLAALPEAAGFVGDEVIDPALNEAITDPAERDMLLDTLRRLAPTGRAGIHTLEVGARHAGYARLSQRERIVITEALRHPLDREVRHGRFVGTVREIDMDKTRLHLRGVPEIGALRCILPTMTKESVRTIIGETVRVGGRYAVDREGRPRLLYVESIEPVDRQLPL